MLPKTSPLVVCLLDGGWTQLTGTALYVVARGRRKMKVNGSPVVGDSSWFAGSTFTLVCANGLEYTFGLDGGCLGVIPDSAPESGAVSES